MKCLLIYSDRPQEFLLINNRTIDMEEKFLAQNIMIQFPRDRYNAQKLTEAFKNASIVRQNRLLNCVLTMLSIFIQILLTLEFQWKHDYGLRKCRSKFSDL